MSDWYKEWLSIDRIDPNWNYSKENCRWIPLKYQQRNKTNTRYVSINWKVFSAVSISENENISVYRVLKKYWRCNIDGTPFVNF